MYYAIININYKLHLQITSLLQLHTQDFVWLAFSVDTKFRIVSTLKFDSLKHIVHLVITRLVFWGTVSWVRFRRRRVPCA